MLTYNNIRFIGVDHGYGNIKTATNNKNNNIKQAP